MKSCQSCGKEFQRLRYKGIMCGECAKKQQGAPVTVKPSESAPGGRKKHARACLGCGKSGYRFKDGLCSACAADPDIQAAVARHRAEEAPPRDREVIPGLWQNEVGRLVEVVTVHTDDDTPIVEFRVVPNALFKEVADFLKVYRRVDDSDV